MSKDKNLVKTYSKSIAEDLIGKKINYFDSIKLSEVILENINDYPINTIYNLFVAVKNALDKMEIPIKKTAYPQGYVGLTTTSPHNIAIWIQAMRAIYGHVSQGMEINGAFDLVTEKWNKMDKRDFKNWMAFYQQDGHKAYKKASDLEKTAQKYIEMGSGGFLPYDRNDLRATIPGVPSRIPDMRQYDRAVEEDELVKKQKADLQKKLDQEELQKQIKALIGRLNAAERIATTKGLDKALGPVYETWLKALHDLKREIQIAPLRNIKSTLLIDLIVRKGNQLKSYGFIKPAQLMYKLAQVAPPPLEIPKDEAKSEEKLPAKDEAKLETKPEAGNELELPAAEAPMPNMDMPSFGPEANDEEWVEEFLKGLSGLIDDNDTQDVQDVNDSDSDDELYVDEDDLVVTAQTAPLPTKTQTQTGTGANLESKNSDIDNALNNITVQDIVARLESLSNIFKNREISRQLAMVDIMMDRLGIASYFPNLAEATTKSLDANQYVLTRVEDILGKLRGTIDTAVQIDLNKSRPATSGVQQSLQQQEQQDSARKELREKAKESQEDAAISGQDVPPTQELTHPAQVQQPGPGVRV